MDVQDTQDEIPILSILLIHVKSVSVSRHSPTSRTRYHQPQHVAQLRPARVRLAAPGVLPDQLPMCRQVVGIQAACSVRPDP